MSIRFLIPVILLVMGTAHAQVPPDKYVFLIIIDGARYSETLGDASGKYTPRMLALSTQGTVIDSFINDSVTYTNRGIPAILGGSWSAPRDTVINGVSTLYASVPSVWEYFRKKYHADSSSAIYFMRSIESPWLPSYHPDYGPSYWPWYSLEGNSDIEVWHSAKSKILAYHPRLAVLYFTNVDDAGHAGDWPEYTNAISVVDSIVGALWDMIQADDVLKNKSTVIVTNDHGRHLDTVSVGFSGHGDACWGCRHIMFLALGPDIKQGFHYSALKTIPDIAPTIGKILNFSTPYATGTPLEAVFSTSGIAGHPVKPEMFALSQNYPNPFNPSTMLRYQVPITAKVSLKVFDVLGKEIARLVDEEKSAGSYEVEFNASNLPSGVYFCQFRAGTFAASMKLLLLK